MYEELHNLEKKYKMFDFPLNVAIEPTNFCNLRCITCANDRLTRPRGAMDIRLYKKIINEIAEVNPYTRIWLDYYGEPLIQKFKIYYMINYAKACGLKNIGINTNGTLLDEEMAEMLLDSGLDFLSIDCDGFTKEVYEKIRIHADRDITYKNIEYILKRKKERKVDQPIIEIKIMEMKENVHEIEQIIAYWRQRGAYTAKRRMVTWGGQLPELLPNIAVERIACGRAIGTLAITQDGKCPLCTLDINAAYACGDIWKESIQSIWNRRNSDFVSKHMRHEFDSLPQICQDCPDWQIIGEERWDDKGRPISKNYETNNKMLVK